MQLDLVIDTDSEGEIPPEDFFHDAQPQPCVQGPPLEQSGVFSFLSSAPAWDLNHLLSQASMNKNSENVNLSAEDITRLPVSVGKMEWVVNT
ncbi:hypothetical protein DIPPA_00250 [Diplonema papillatum]|nr:hypothetical protein DIPPA_00250 [Diplonema papillatum]